MPHNNIKNFLKSLHFFLQRLLILFPFLPIRKKEEEFCITKSLSLISTNEEIVKDISLGDMKYKVGNRVAAHKNLFSLDKIV